MVSSNYVVCGSKKSRLIKEQEADEIICGIANTFK